MKYKVLALLLASAAVPAFAETSVTLYGIIDEGLDFVTNSGGKRLYQMRDGTYDGIYGSRWGLKGSEDLGDGLAAIFQLENGFSLENGQLRQGGLLFGRQAYVGLSSKRYGALTFGRQYDSIVDYFAPVTLNGNWGGMFVHSGDIDNSSNSFRVNNSIKYASPSFGGLSFGGMYSFSNTNAAGTSTTGMWSLGAKYAFSGVTLAAGYLHATNPGSIFADGDFVGNTTGSAIGAGGPWSYVGQPKNEQIVGAGATWAIGKALIGVDYSDTKFDDANGTTSSVRFDNYEVWGNYALTSALTLGGGYTFTDGRVNYNGARPKYHQIGLLADYKLSKRTEVYLMGTFQKAAGSATVADIYDGSIAAASSNNRQLATRVAMVHKF